MKIVIFAGGVGTRLWPLSRKNSPKQFGKIIGERSTLQETVQRLQPEFSFSDIYIATGKRYESIVLEQLPQIPRENFIFEPEMRDVGPAIGLVMHLLKKKFPHEPTAILWSDHLVKQVETFKHCLRLAEEAILQKESQFVFIAQKPRFANQNMGWIALGKEKETINSVYVYEFKKLIYRPKLEEAKAYFSDPHYAWNLGYFVTTPDYLSSLYASFAPEMTQKLQTIVEANGTQTFETVLAQTYKTFEKITFDDLILAKINPQGVFVIYADLGWSDVGAWESLKEALSKTESENITKGNVLLEDSKDSLVFNYNGQLTVGIDLDQMLVINTEDVLLICPKTSVPKIKKLVESLSGTPHENLT